MKTLDIYSTPPPSLHLILPHFSSYYRHHHHHHHHHHHFHNLNIFFFYIHLLFFFFSFRLYSHTPTKLAVEFFSALNICRRILPTCIPESRQIGFCCFHYEQYDILVSQSCTYIGRLSLWTSETASPWSDSK